MKSLLALILLVPALTFGQAMNMATPRMPVLTLKKFRDVDNSLSWQVFIDNPKMQFPIGSLSQPVKDFFKAAKDSDILKISCDGEFFLANSGGIPYMHINSLKVCVDEQGEVLAHSLGLKANLKDAEVAASKKFIVEAMKPATANLPNVVNDSTKPKEVEKVGFVSPRLASKTTQK